MQRFTGAAEGAAQSCGSERATCCTAGFPNRPLRFATATGAALPPMRMRDVAAVRYSCSIIPCDSGEMVPWGGEWLVAAFILKVRWAKPRRHSIDGRSRQRTRQVVSACDWEACSLSRWHAPLTIQWQLFKETIHFDLEKPCSCQTVLKGKILRLSDRRSGRKGQKAHDHSSCKDGSNTEV